MVRYASLVVILLVLLAVGWLFVQLMAQFFFSLFLAALLVVVFRPLHDWMVTKCGGKHSLAAGLTTTAILAIVLVPMLALAIRAGVEGVSLAANFDRDTILQRLAKLRGAWGLELPADQAERWRGLGVLVTQLAPYSQHPDQALTTESLRDKSYLHALLEQTRTLAAALQRPDEALADGALAAPVPAAPVPVAVTTAVPEPVPNGAVAPPPLAAAEPPLEGTLLAVIERAQAKFSAGDPVGLSLALSDVQPAFLRMRQQRLGGPLRAYLVEWANPSPEQLGQAQGAVIRRLQQSFGPLAVGTGQLMGSIMFSFGIVAVTIFFMYADGPGMLAAVTRLLPVDQMYVKELLQEFDQTCRAVVAATLLSAFGQGLLAGVGYYFAGLEAVFLLTMVTMLMALVPFVGPAVVWFPCSLWLMFVQEGRFWSGVGLMTFGFLAVSTIDNLIKPYVLSGRAKMHPLPALLSVLGGVQVLGPLGIFVGPMIVALLQSLLTILNQELQRVDARREQPLSAGPVPGS